MLNTMLNTLYTVIYKSFVYMGIETIFSTFWCVKNVESDMHAIPIWLNTRWTLLIDVPANNIPKLSRKSSAASLVPSMLGWLCQTHSFCLQLAWIATYIYVGIDNDLGSTYTNFNEGIRTLVWWTKLKEKHQLREKNHEFWFCPYIITFHVLPTRKNVRKLLTYKPELSSPLHEENRLGSDKVK